MKEDSIEDLKKRIADLEQRDKRLTAELHEFKKAETVMIAAGLVTEQKVKQAHEIVQSFSAYKSNQEYGPELGGLAGSYRQIAAPDGFVSIGINTRSKDLLAVIAVGRQVLAVNGYDLTYVDIASPNELDPEIIDMLSREGIEVTTVTRGADAVIKLTGVRPNTGETNE